MWGSVVTSLNYLGCVVLSSKSVKLQKFFSNSFFFFKCWILLISFDVFNNIIMISAFKYVWGKVIHNDTFFTFWYINFIVIIIIWIPFLLKSTSFCFITFKILIIFIENVISYDWKKTIFFVSLYTTKSTQRYTRQYIVIYHI